jgi:hypothetical protein
MEAVMSKLPWWLILVVKILLVDVLIALLVAAWSWIAGDFSPIGISNCFFSGGILMILISLASGLGNWGNRSDWRQMLAQSAGQANLAERGQRMAADIVQVYALTFVLIPAGLGAILVAVLVGNLA